MIMANINDDQLNDDDEHDDDDDDDGIRHTRPSCVFLYLRNGIGNVWSCTNL